MRIRIRPVLCLIAFLYAIPTLAAPLTVSINFDDGWSEITQAATMLQSHGMRGTFFIISGAKSSGYATLNQIRAIQAAGHEIGGHTMTHAHLLTLSPEDVQRQICNDRTTLLGSGLNVQTLAYPFGEFDSNTEAAAQACGYTSARGLAQVNDQGDVAVETVPPLDPYAIRTPWSIQSTDTLDSIEQIIVDAEAQGGWLPIVFHRICNAAPCEQYSIAASDFEGLLTWLGSRPTTIVKTMREVTGGSPQPPVYLPHPVLNPSFESDVVAPDGVPDFWSAAGYGTNTATWQRVTDAYNGSYAERVDVTSFSNGAARFMPIAQSSVPPARPGRIYRLSGWYKSNAKPMWSAYYRDPSGNWIWWTQSPSYAASESWAQATFDTPPLPAGADAVYFGLSLYSNGWMVIDDLDFQEIAFPTTVSLVAPTDGSKVSGNVTLTATAIGPVGVASVSFYANGTLIQSISTPPYTALWNSTTVADGPVSLSAVVQDNQGATATSVVQVAVANTSVLLLNPSLESDVSPVDAVPDCWSPILLANTTGKISRTSDAHSGSSAELISLTAVGTGGGARLVPTQDSGKCAPAGVPGKTYTVSGWYKSSAQPRWVFWYRSAAGVWTWWAQSPVLFPSSTWTQSTWTTPPLPAGATNVSFGLSIYGTGMLTMDDFALTASP